MRRHPSEHDDRGAALLLAIGFVLLVSAISAALAALIMTNSRTGVVLDSVRNRQYAADAAIQDAIVRVRLLDRATSPSCGFESTFNEFDIRVDCGNAISVVGTGDNVVLSQRNVIFVACEDTNSPCDDADVIIRAQVNFEQRYTDNVTKTFIQSWSVNR